MNDGERVRAPYVGAIVFYQPRADCEPVAAIITRVDRDHARCVGLHLFAPADKNDWIPAQCERGYDIDLHCVRHGRDEAGCWWWSMADGSPERRVTP